MQFVSQLSPPLRNAFHLRALDGLTTSEAAHILGVPDGTVKARARTSACKAQASYATRLSEISNG